MEIQEKNIRRWTIEHKDSLGLSIEQIAEMTCTDLVTEIKKHFVILRAIKKNNVGSYNYYIFKEDELPEYIR